MKYKKLTTYLVLVIIIFMGLLFFGNSAIAAESSGEGEQVYIIPIEDTVEQGLKAFLSRATQVAEDKGADYIIFEVDTPGGRVDAAGQIAELIQNLETPTIAFIVNKALSAGSYIALNTDTIYMKAHATMGASGVINRDGTAANKKAQSAWLAAMKSAAESQGRDPKYAAAMANPEIDLPELGAPKGEYLTLGPESAVEVGYAAGIVEDRTELLNEMGIQNATIIEIEPTLSEKLARFLTNPIVIPILLTIASLGLIIEIFSPGFGIPGIIGLLSLVLFFYGHIVAGLAGMEAIILIILGIILIIAEFFVPGGIVGVLGIGCVVASLFISGQDIGQMAMSIGIAFLISIITAVILFKRIGMEKGVFRHIILKDKTSTELGYVSTVNRLELIGLEGKTLTQLRPSGTARFDEERLDVVSEGRFIQEEQPIKIIKVEGSRIVVREI
ncbi:nodulation protein NfeD [Virgibacillus necropolis]|uniref:NfeD family protein n=1 Tax=Virgibacillus necropolis TaxID=163877 RepID=UPI00384F3E62